MAEHIELLGMTWDHPRGFDPMLATSKAYQEKHPHVHIKWEKRSLQAFADRPIHEMANTYDLMVIDHPHVGEVAQAGNLVAFDGLGRDQELAELAKNSVGASHISYQFEGRQWALAIDAATPVATYRSDMISDVPKCWNDVKALAKDNQVIFALIPINALMVFMGLAKNLDYTIAEHEDRFIPYEQGETILEMLLEITSQMDELALSLDPIGVFNLMSGQKDAPAYSPFGYGYTNYSRDGFAKFPLDFTDAPGVLNDSPKGTVLGGTGIAVSAASTHQDIALDYAFYIASAGCQSGLFLDAGGQPAHAQAWESPRCNALTRNFFMNTRETLETSWVRPRYDGYMGFQDQGGEIIHKALRGEATLKSTLEALEAAYGKSRK